jgi:adenylate cyclase
VAALDRENVVAETERGRLRRRLTAVLLADFVGYSRLMNIDEESTHIRLADCIKILIEPTAALYEGRLIRSKGDGLLIEFDSAVNAVNCAVDIQHGLAAREEARLDNDKLRLRIGINSGDVIVDEDDIYGNSVNIAARLEALAEPGGISVTATVRDQLLGHPGLFFEDTGHRWVKNIDRPIRVYRVTHHRATESENRSLPSRIFEIFSRRLGRRGFPLGLGLRFGLGTVVIVATIAILELPIWKQSPVLPAQASIMVLPFRNLNGPDEQYFADAVTDILTTDLSRLSDTMVISRSTAFTYKDKLIDPREIRRELGIRYILEGSIEKIGTKVEVNAELVDTGSTSTLWADGFESELADPFALQEAVTGRIAASLHLQLVRAEDRRITSEQTTDPDAYDLRLHAMAYLIGKITPEKTRDARHALEEAVKRDPTSAESWAELAWVLMTDFLANWNDAPDDLVKQAENAVQEAKKIDPSIALAHLAEGWVLREKGYHQFALNAFDEALQSDPNLATALVAKANQLLYLGRAPEAPALVKKAIELSPLDPDLGRFHWIMGRAYFTLGDYNKAIDELQKSIQLRPPTWFISAQLISAYALTKRLKENEAEAAIREYKRKFSKWRLLEIQKYYENETKYRDADPTYKATIQKLLDGLQIAKNDAGFS